MEKAVKENDFHQAALLKEQLAECEKKREDILQEMNLNKINEPQRVEKVLNSKNIFLFHYQHYSLSLSLSENHSVSKMVLILDCYYEYALGGFFATHFSMSFMYDCLYQFLLTINNIF